MSKQTIAITVDSEILDQIRQLHINVSGTINEFLASYIASYNDDIEGINIKLEKLNLEKAVKKLNYWQGLIKKSQGRIEKWEALQKEKEESKLKEEKEKAEQARKCIKCKKILDEKLKVHEFKAGIVCNICYQNMSGDEYRRWQTKS